MSNPKSKPTASASSTVIPSRQRIAQNFLLIWVDANIKPICEALQVAAKQCNQDSVAVSFVFVDEEATGVGLN